MIRTTLLYLCAIFLIAASPAATTGPTSPTSASSIRYDLGEFDFRSLLGDPPALQSSDQARDLAAVLAAQAARTPEQIEQCVAEDKPTPFLFASIIGDRFDVKNCPAVSAIFENIRVNVKRVSDKAKKIWNRPRPGQTDPRVQLCVPAEKSASYPSGHATNATVWALVLAEIFPASRAALIARADRIGTDRVIAGEHYPTDVAAGKKLGTEITKRLLADKNFQIELAEMKAECVHIR